MKDEKNAILSPSWIKPSFAEPGGEIRMKVLPGEAGISSVSAVSGACSIKLDARAADDEERAEVVCRIPAGAPPGFFSLEVLQSSGNRLRAPNSLKILEPGGELTLFHISDIHIHRSPEGTLAKLVDLINRAGPDFVVNTGDVIDRYGRGPSDLLPEEEVRRQIKLACREMLRLECPLFFLPGNHDLAFPWYAAMWNEYGHDAFRGKRGDYSFDLRGVHFTALESSLAYDEETFSAISPGFTESRLRWLAGDIESSREQSKRIVFVHYDYTRRQLPEALENLPVDAVFYGHSKKRIPWKSTADGFIDGHLEAGTAYQIITAGNGAIRVEPGPAIDEI